jgi:hypothetical protein
MAGFDRCQKFIMAVCLEPLKKLREFCAPLVRPMSNEVGDQSDDLGKCSGNR